MLFSSDEVCDNGIMAKTRQSVRTITMVAPLLAALTLVGCAELYEEYSTWPDLPPPEPVASARPVGSTSVV